MISDKDDSLESSIEDEEINFLNVCSVCGYQKGKNNYGAFTCSSCKVFFRRNADLNLNKIQCKYQGECQININNRKICRICRLKKCFAVGMCKDLFRPSYTIYSSNKSQNQDKKEDDKLINNNFELTFDQQLILLNLIDNYDLCSPISDIIQMIKNSSNNPTKIRLKIDKNNLIIIQNKFYSSIILFIKLNNKFNYLSKIDRYILIKRNIHNLSQLNQLFIYNQIQFLNDPFEKSCILDEYGSLYFDYLLKTIQKMPSDIKIIKLFLIILTFSTCSDKIDFNINRFCEEHNYLSNSLNLLNIQNIYLEILFKYLINNFGYEEATKQFQNLIQIILTQNKFLQICLNNEKHYQAVEIIINKIEEDYKMDYQQLMDSSN